MNLKQDILKGAETAFIDSSQISNISLQPRFLTNDVEKGNKVISEIIEELRNCTEFNFSVAFVTLGGIEPLLEALKELEGKKVPGRILTTDYLCFSEPKALRKLHELENIELRMFRCGQQIGFHAKGYSFVKENGVHTHIIGSSNLTQAALCLNKEWNTKFSSLKDGAFSRQLDAEFEALWNSECTQPFDEFIELYEKAYKSKPAVEPITALSAETMRPNSMQKEFIKELKNIRERGETRALLISATGTGKTFAAAFAVRDLFEPKRMLFIVHRETICKQAKASFDKILHGKNISTGLVSGNQKDYSADYIFATMSSVARNDVAEKLGVETFDLIIIDEVHRAGCESYQRIMDCFKPQFWLGMTASPDRTDEFNIYELFNYNIAYEIRLHEAMKEGMLCPFHYFGISDLKLDDSNFEDDSDVNFNMLTSEQRVNHILSQAEYYGYSGDRVRGLVFCNRNNVAAKLSESFNIIGYKTIALSARDPQEYRDAAIERLSLGKNDEKRLDYIFTVDLFNEGVDIPEVNQIIMLRPTQSNIVFIQQLGRGLRKHAGKEFVVILDFIANYKNNYMIPQALSGDTSGKKDALRRFALEGTKVLPGSSTIHFDAIAREQIFRAIDNARFGFKTEIENQYKILKNKLGRIPTLIDFDKHNGMDPLLIIDKYGSYHAFLSEFDKDDYPYRFTEDQKKFLKYVSCQFAAGKRPHELEALKLLLDGCTSLFSALRTVLQQQYGIEMSANCQINLINLFTGQFIRGNMASAFASTIFIKKANEGDYTVSDEFAEALASAPFCAQLREVIDFALSRHAQFYRDAYQDTSFVLYRQYSYADTYRLLNWEKGEIDGNVSGYKYDESTHTYPVFVNYEKKKDIAASINYKDEFINELYFKHLSKSPRKLKSPDVQRFLNSERLGIRIDLFVRKNKDDKTRKEFYYLGRMRPSDLREPQLVRMSGTNNTAVETVYKLDTPVRADIYDYLTSNLTMKRIEVVAAVIIHGKKLFATQRGYGEFKDGWEFPGGKIEPGETPEAALVREIREELNADIAVGQMIRTVEYDYSNFHLTMHCYQCVLESENLELLEHEDAVWVDAQSLDSIDWLPADRLILDDIRKLLS